MRDIVRDADGLYLRVATVLSAGSKNLVIVSSEPFDKELVGKIAADMGEITVSDAGLGRATDRGVVPDSASHTSVTQNTANGQGNVHITQDGKTIDLQPTFTVGTVPPPDGSMDREVTFPAPLSVLDWNTGKRERHWSSAAGADSSVGAVSASVRGVGSVGARRGIHSAGHPHFLRNY